MSLSILRIKCLNKVFYVALFSLVLLLINILIPIQFKPNETNALTGTVNPSILTFSSISSVSRVAILNNDSSNGSFVTSNANDAVRFSIATNNYTGYTLRIKSSSGDTTLSNGEYSINSINGITTLTDFRNPSNTNYNNKWGLLPSKYANGDIIVTNTNAYLPIPNTTGTILNITTSANSNDGVSNPDEYSIGIGVRVDYNTVTGDYETNALVLEYVANPITYSITYDANDGNDGADTTNMPTINPETGSVDATTASTITLSSKIPEREGFVFQGWCTVQVADDASCIGTEYQPGDIYGIDFTVLNTTILYARWTMANYSITIKTSTGISNVSLNGTSCTNSTTGCEITGLVYNQSYTLTGTLSEGYSFSAWSKSGSGSIADATALTTSFTVGMGTATITASATPNLYTCTKQYRLQNADGTFPDNYTADGTEQVYFGDTCSYSKTVTDYKGSESGTNDAEASTGGTMVVGGLTLSLDLYRNTYDLTVVAGTNTSNATGSGAYGWGRNVTIEVTKATDNACTTYSMPAWTATSGTTPSSGASTSYTMPKSNATVTATSNASNFTQTITLNKGTGVSGIKINNTNYTDASVSLYCGSYNITGSYDSDYIFASWARTDGVTVTSTSSATTTMTVSGDGTLTLNGKDSALGKWCTSASTCMQTATSCGSSLTDSRTGVSYLTATIGGKCFMEQNLYLPTGYTLYSTDSNITRTSWTTPTTSLTAGDIKTEARMVAGTHPSSTYNATGGWYNYCAASAGTVCSNSQADATQDICPKGWRLPNRTEMSNVSNAGRSNWKFSAGLYKDGTLTNSSSSSDWWLATSSSWYQQYSLHYFSNGLYENFADKGTGRFVRCVRK